jgi:uncharacterized SAM-binding protein YcdF (DUF218 family)
MLDSLRDFIVALTYPPAMSLCLLLVGAVAVVLRRRKLAAALSALAIAWSLLWSIPWCSEQLRAALARNYPVIVEAALPKADAIVVLGGGHYGSWLRRDRVDPDELKHSRLAAGARAWQAARAPLIILSGGGNGRGVSEAETMAAAIAKTGIPASAIMLEDSSDSTRDNARMTAMMAREHGMRTVLLVTSSVHMPRAALLFRNAGVDVVPVPVPESKLGERWRERWVPTRGALWRSGRALKEYVALFALHAETAWRGPDRASAAPGEVKESLRRG